MNFIELLIIVSVALLVLGPKQLAQLAGWLGNLVRYARKLGQEVKTGFDDYCKEQTLKENIAKAEMAELAQKNNVDADPK